MSIFKFGSCRTNISEYLKGVNINYNYDLTHTTKEVIMYLDLFDNINNINKLINPKYLMNNPHLFDAKYFYKMYNDAKIIIIEISSLNLYKLDNEYYQCVRYKSNCNTLQKCTIITQDEESFKNDIKYISNRINKPIIFIPHININFYDVPKINGFINHRQILEKYISKYCDIYIY